MELRNQLFYMLYDEWTEKAVYFEILYGLTFSLDQHLIVDFFHHLLCKPSWIVFLTNVQQNSHVIIYAFWLFQRKVFEKDQPFFEGGRFDVFDRGEVETGMCGDKLSQQPQKAFLFQRLNVFFENSEDWAECFEVDIGWTVIKQTAEKLSCFIDALMTVSMKKLIEGRWRSGGRGGVKEVKCLILV